MNIAGLSMSMATSNTQTQFGVAMLSKTIDQNNQQGEAIAQMIDTAAMERSVHPNVGGNFDFSV